MRPGATLPAAHTGRHGDGLGHALVALRPPDVAPKHVHLEDMLAATRSKTKRKGA